MMRRGTKFTGYKTSCLFTNRTIHSCRSPLHSITSSDLKRRANFQIQFPGSSASYSCANLQNRTDLCYCKNLTRNLPANNQVQKILRPQATTRLLLLEKSVAGKGPPYGRL